MRGSSCVECIRKLKAVLPRLPIIIFAEQGYPAGILVSLIAGASGHLMKPVLPQDLLGALNTVVEGGTALCQRSQNLLVHALHIAGARTPAGTLTYREEQLMSCILERKSDKEIADQLRISSGTVHAHLSAWRARRSA